MEHPNGSKETTGKITEVGPPYDDDLSQIAGRPVPQNSD
jgi:hypothetical protein